MPRLATTHHRMSAATPTRRRPDVVPNLLHLINAGTRRAAFDLLNTIIADRRVPGGDGTRDGSRCVCFAEAPIRHLRDVFHWSAERSQSCQPYGVLLGKDYLYALGGRPVIYQPDAEYEQLPESLRYRHERFDPLANPPADSTWVREWRLRTDVMSLDPERCCIVVASEEDRAALFSAYAEHEELRLEALVSGVSRSLEGQFVESFPWPVISLEI